MLQKPDFCKCVYEYDRHKRSRAIAGECSSLLASLQKLTLSLTILVTYTLSLASHLLYIIIVVTNLGVSLESILADIAGC